jgi:phosphorylase kinase alpha/beta subunit
MYFYVHEDNVEYEKQEPGSHIRHASGEGSGVKGMFLWNQAMFVIAQLLTAGLLHINELDPIRRYLPSYNRPRTGGRYSAFQVSTDIFDGVLCTHRSSRVCSHVQIFQFHNVRVAEMFCVLAKAFDKFSYLQC